MRRWLKRLGLVFALLTIAGIGYQLWGEWRDKRVFPLPGQLVDVGGHRLHIWCVGQGSPTVLMLSGGGTPTVTMYDAQTRIGAFTRVCSYDRAGLGWSDPPTKPMSLPDMVDDLDALLLNGNIDGPFVLVPESFGGMVALAYAQRNPTKIAGAVFVDASEPDLWFRVSPKSHEAMKRNDMLWQVGWRLGIIRAALPFAAPDWVANLSPKLKGEFEAVWSRPMASFANDAIDAFQQTKISQRPSATPGLLGESPIIVLRHGKSGGMGTEEDFEKEWPAAQAKLAELSSDSRLIVAKENGHPIAEENPQLVADAVREIVSKVREQTNSDVGATRK
jgi:pimeloyl-ACP methyl ester carboxylesterase